MTGRISELTEMTAVANNDYVEIIDESGTPDSDTRNMRILLRKLINSSMKTSVRVTTTVAQTLATDFENGDTIDGVVLATGNRILIKNQATSADNGIYTVNASGSPTRAKDFDVGSDQISTSTIMVSEGTVNALSFWQCNAAEPITIGSTSLTFSSVWRVDQIVYREISTPTSVPADKNRTFLVADGGINKLRTIDEYGLTDQIGVRDSYRFKNKFFLGLGSDLAVTATDCQALGWAATLEGTVSNQMSATEAHYKRFATAATIDTDGGAFSTSFVWLSLDQNPDVTIKFAAESSAVRRCWIGFVEADHMASDSTAATHKFALRLSTSPAVTGFTIVHSDGTTETVESQIQASDTNFHTIRLIGDNANSRWGYSFDGATIVWITTNIPSASQKMGLQVQLRTLENVAKNMAISWIDGVADK